MIGPRFELRDALVIVRTSDDTIVIPSVTGELFLDAQIVEGAVHGQIGQVWEKDMDRVSHYEVTVTGTAPGTIAVPHRAITSPPATEQAIIEKQKLDDQKEG